MVILAELYITTKNFFYLELRKVFAYIINLPQLTKNYVTEFH